MAEFRLLGPVEVWTSGRLAKAGPPRQRAVLAALLVDAGRPVAVEAMVDRVWGRTPPVGARHALHTHIGRIRRVLAELDGDDGAIALVHRAGGYLLDMPPELVDMHRFRGLVERARDPELTGDELLPLLRAARQLWRGEPLAGLTGQWAARVRDGLRAQYVDATVQWARAEVAAGEAEATIGTLADLLAEHPLMEPLSAVLMRALHAAGRTADALACYAEIRARLIDELGTEPGADLRAVHLMVLRDNDGGPAATAEPAKLAAPPPHGPAQLPLDVPGFTGRTAELARLDAALAAVAGQPTAVVISALLGTAGVGKTALAVHWAHSVADRFPDGQLYVNLRGFDPAGSQLNPGVALRGFLDALNVPAARIPTDLAEQSALFRSVLAGRRFLLVLDNARDADQVRPLLPGTAGSLVVVTSRNQLTGLVAAEGAHPVALDLLSAAEARELLGGRLGAARVEAEPDAVDDIVRRCARLPLALALVAARATANPQFPLHLLATELRAAKSGLDVLAGADAATDVRAVFSWSYSALSSRAAELFRLLGVHPGPDVSTVAAASLAAVPVSRARALLGELARAHLVAEHVPGRFGAHDLLREYAAELAQSLDDAATRQAASDRALDHYLHTAYAAATLLQPYIDPIVLPPPHDGAAPVPLTDHEQAMAWFTAEHQVLLTAARQAARTGRDAQAWQLAWTMETFLHRRGHPHDLVATQVAALEAARRSDDRAGQAWAHRGLARAYAALGNYHDAHRHFARALALFEEVGDRAGLARTHLDFAHVLESQGSHEEALRQAERALPVYRAVGHRAGLAYTLNSVGWFHAQLGDAARAEGCCQQALALHRELGDRYGEAAALDSVGVAHHQQGRHREAIDCFEQSVALLGPLGSRYYEAVVLTHLGDAHDAMGDGPRAGQAWRRALDILNELDHPAADRVRATTLRQVENAAGG